MLLMAEKGIRGGICHSVYRYAKANSKYMKNYDENKESSYIQYWDVNNLCGQAMSQKVPVNNFEWIKDTFQFNEDFIKTYNEESDEGFFLEDRKVQQFVINLHDKTGYVMPIKKFKTSFKSWISFKESSLDD